MKNLKNSRAVAVAVLAGLLPLAGGCAHVNRKAAAAAVPASAPASAPAPSAVAASGSRASDQSAETDQEPSLRNKLMQSVAELKPAYFAYDSAFLDDASRGVLAKNAEWLKDHPEIQVQIAGNCDSRGTEEYNLALGERRAQSARSYYMALGIPGNRIATISYGKEKPVCEQASAACWSSERRDDTLQAVSGAVSFAPRSRMPR